MGEGVSGTSFALIWQRVDGLFFWGVLEGMGSEEEACHYPQIV